MSIAAAYAASVVQQHHGFPAAGCSRSWNAPLFATFALGMFWKRATGHAPFWTGRRHTRAAAHHGLSLPAGAAAGIKGGYLGAVTTYPSEARQTFWTAIIAWSTCFG